eukprot:TRINITY_DN55234_c0_g1_i1.p1 TRINITY_DN55234_c0_g1~~TRINITY_DN55234_c0_g1_i1.p1  ORF type:complete len:237 (+),score=32.02 TRINITY_DN55234_c0_g1_i1:229-939(+)
MFLEQPPGMYSHAHEAQISYMARKYLGVPSYTFSAPEFTPMALGSSGLSSVAPDIKLPQLESHLRAHPGWGRSPYSWGSEQVHYMLAEKGALNAEMRAAPEAGTNGLVLLGPRDVAGLRSAVEKAQEDPHMRLILVCRERSCTEYTHELAGRWVAEILFQDHKHVQDSKVLRVQPTTEHAAVFFSRLLLDLATVLEAFRFEHLYYWKSSPYVYAREVLEIVSAAREDGSLKVHAIN